MFGGEPDASRRAVRPFLRGFRLPYNGALTYRLDSIIAGEIVLVMPDGTRETWTRAPADSRSIGRCTVNKVISGGPVETRMLAF